MPRADATNALGLQAQANALYELLADGVDPEDADTLFDLQGRFEAVSQGAQAATAEWAEGCALIEENLTAEAAKLRDQANRYTALARAREDSVDRLKAHVSETMHTLDARSIRTAFGTWSLSEREKAEYTDEAALLAQEEFKRVKIEVDKTAVSAALKARRLIVGAELVTYEVLSIRRGKKKEDSE